MGKVYTTFFISNMEHTLPSLEHKYLERQTKIIILNVHKYLHKTKMEHARKYGIDMNVIKEVAEATGISYSTVKRLMTKYRKMTDIEEVVRGPIKVKTRARRKTANNGTTKRKRGKKNQATTSSTETDQANLNEPNNQNQDRMDVSTDKINVEKTKVPEGTPNKNISLSPPPIPNPLHQAANENSVSNIKQEMVCDSTGTDSEKRDSDTKRKDIKLEPIDINYDGDMPNTFKMEFV